MKRLFFIALVVLFSTSLFAQTDVVKNRIKPILEKKQMQQPAQAKYVTLHQGVNFKYDIPTGTPIGLTNYDLQSNSSVARRMIKQEDGRISAVWLQDQSTAPGGSTRGTGYAYFDGSAWQYIEMTGNERVEGERAGWPTLMSNGTEEFVVSHYRSAGGLFGHYQTIGTSGSGWSSNDLTGGPEAMLWPRAASAGEYYYVIAVDDFPTGGMPESLHFYKSDDHGQTWAYKGTMPDFNTYYNNANGDQYAIDAYDSIVAVVYFGSLSDTRLWKSTDYGETWTQMVINDFPVDGYSFTGGSIVDVDNNGTADTVVSTDNIGDVIIDNDGVVHVVFGRMRYLDEDASDGQFSYFPYTDWILYWNETMGEGHWDGTMTGANNIDLAVPAAVDTIGWCYDLNGNGQWDFADAGNEIPFGTYYSSLTAFPTLAIDDNNRIYCAYTTVMEGANYIKTDATPNPQSYRAVWVRAKAGQSWGDPVCISDADGTQAENVFPTLARRADDNIYLWVQWDNEPGLHIRGDEDGVTDNYIVFKSVSVDTLFAGLSMLYITVQPEDVEVCEGSEASFEIQAEGQNLTYQWQKDGTDISGATSNIYTISNTTVADQGSYTCVVTDGTDTVTSDTATLTVNQNVSITTQPSDVTVCEGGDATFTVTASGADATYQWYKFDVPISGATSSDLVLSNVSLADSGLYKCVVSGNCGSDTSDVVTLTVNKNTVIIDESTDQPACAGADVTFFVSAEGVNLTYQWQKDGVDISGANNAVYTINNVSASDAAVYTCVVNGDCGTATSSNMTLSITTSMELPDILNKETCVGEDVVFHVTANATNVTYQWRKDGVDLTDGGNISGATTADLTISSVSDADVAGYDCIVNSDCGTDTSNVANLMLLDPTAVTAVSGDTTLNIGDTVTFFVTATGSNLAYQWYKDNVSIHGATEATYTIEGVLSADAGAYYVVVTGDCGTDTTNEFNVTVIPTAVKEVTTVVPAFDFTIYPNPTMGMITVDLKGIDNDVYYIQVFNINGKLVYTNTLHNAKNQVDLQQPAGLYLVRVFSKTNSKTMKLIVK